MESKESSSSMLGKIGKIKVIMSFPRLLVVIMSLVGYFVYGKTFDHLLGMLLVGIILYLISFIGIIPFVGVGIYWGGLKFLLPKLLLLTGIPWSWPVGILYWSYFVTALMFTIISSIHIIVRAKGVF
ncbi:MAG: hypothetical protein BWY03_00056 [Parcubacteria group bacterium ADurb.Bin159]|jgi:hypothetical protein|nr:MAG: hypothetical protein BWY03_00056 [Parcubacteria group bacterium ADurb.Bin159]